MNTHTLKICAALLLVQTIVACGKTSDAPAPTAAPVSSVSVATPLSPPVQPTIPGTPVSTSLFVEKPDFTVVVQLTDKAAAIWKATNKPLSIYAEIVDEYGPGMTALAARQQHDIREPGPVHFSGISIALDKLKALRDPNYEVYVGVEPAGQPDDLDCGYVQQLIQDLQHKSFTLSCKLQGEA
ncbi:hypothetical protein [Hydrogenophaga sp.]|uniref:hypothetical protein n=1 Tax=Hydrogenophaga sp. TaxID=1904254 RepID=UPI002728CB00|nr:hypothetical protein [Hydrogenophaga sp.]MDO9436845.1 hypothetical protein [Hydrogenophaga sp.]